MDTDTIEILDKGYVKLIDVFGSDERIESAARISYEKGTRKVSDTRNLLRYLMRNAHWTPFEMCEVLFEIKMPLFDVQQLLRHRTANVNQMSLRYSEAIDDFYIPDLEDIQPQSVDNKQGRDGILSEKNKNGAWWLFDSASEHAFKIYELLLGKKVHSDGSVLIYDPYNKENPLFDDDFNGVARELARTVLPNSNYSKLVWKCDLRNFLGFLRLRLDPHAQKEIRVYAQAMYDLTKDKFPIAFEAFDDFVRFSTNVSRMEKNLLVDLLNGGLVGTDANFTALTNIHGSEKELANSYGMSIRDLTAFKKTWNIGANNE